ncbi:MAG: hypothetical protein FJ388_07170 [Verrucomicrobia bacterium]|nr:hypothetical protein [Verrucomicrobiota bacterium]
MEDDQQAWLERFEAESNDTPAREAKDLVRTVMETLPADARLVLTLLEIEHRSVREVSALNP